MFLETWESWAELSGYQLPLHHREAVTMEAQMVLARHDALTHSVLAGTLQGPSDAISQKKKQRC